MALVRPQSFLVQPGVLKSLVPTETPYLVGSILSIRGGFIFFLSGSAELFVARIVEKTDISDGQ